MNTDTPEKLGLSSERLARIRPALQTFVDADQAPGFLVAIIRHGKIAYFEKIGWMDVDQKRPYNADTIFRIYSMSKPITTAALMILYEEGKVILQDPVSKYIPQFKDLQVCVQKTEKGLQLEPMQREIAILDLALHTSGLGYGLAEDSPVEDIYRQAGLFCDDRLVGAVSLEELIHRLVKIPLANQPGSRWRYSMAIDVIGYLVQMIAGISFDMFLKERIFDPLGMTDTGFFVPQEKTERLASVYRPDESGHIALMENSNSSAFSDPHLPPFGGSGLVSTILDYSRFTQMMLNNGENGSSRILGPKTVEKMTRNHLSPGLLPINLIGTVMPGFGFGPGFGIVLDESQNNFAASDGTYWWGGAASTFFYNDPVEQLSVILLTQVMWNEIAFDQVFRQLVAQAIIE